MKIYNKEGIVLSETSVFEYNGIFLDSRSITCTITSPVTIDFLPGDWVKYRDETFILKYTPTVKKIASPGSKGDAFQYNLKFVSHKTELEETTFIDVVPDDNLLHTATPAVAFTGNVHVLAQRLQANLDRKFKDDDKWTINVIETEETRTTEKNISIKDSNCWNALSLSKSEYGFNFIVDNRTITINTAGNVIGHTFKYGKNNGLQNIERTSVENESIVTRLRVYGSSRNLPKNYNKLEKNPSLYSPELRIPDFSVAPHIDYVDAPNNKIKLYGILEGVQHFEDIFPSIYGVTADDLTAAGGETTSLGRLDEIVFVDPIDIESGTFTVYIKDIGFDINEYLTPSTALLAMRDGNLAGNEFEIVSCKVDSSVDNAGYKLVLNRNDNDHFVLPDDKVTIKPGDHFVLLEIHMPPIYTSMAEVRLLNEARKYLNEYDHARATYAVNIDNILMARNPVLGNSIHEGDLMTVEDEDLGIKRDIIIQSLTIKEGGIIPEYTATLSDQPTATKVDRIQNDIDVVERNFNENRQANEESIRRNVKSLNKVIDRVFDTDGYIKGSNIAPNSIQSNALAIGPRSRNFILNANIKPNYEGDANRVLFTSGELIHREISHAGATGNLSYTWLLNEKISTLSDATADYYVYAKCSVSSGTAEWHLTTEMIRYDNNVSQGWYYFLIGDIYAVEDGVRGDSISYGKTWINGKFITTGMIQSPLLTKGSYWDLDRDILSVGGLTTIDGGLLLSNKIVLKDTQDKIMAGIDGLANLNTDIVFWTGGEQVETESASTGQTPATVIFRKDGSGYLAGKNLWWDAAGKLYSNFSNLYIGNDDITAFVNKFNRMFDFDEENESIKAKYPLYSTGGITAFGTGSQGSGSGGVSTLGQLSNVGAWADTVPQKDRIMVQLAGATHWTEKKLSEIVGLDTAALADYLTANEYATKPFVNQRINDIVAGAPAAFDTLKEIADVLQGNVNSIGDIMTTLATKWTQDNAKISRWDTAYSWGNHASAGYMKSSDFGNYFKKDAQGRIYCEVDFYSKKGITAFSSGSSSGGSGSGGTLSGLSDVALTSPSSGDLLKYNGTHWVNIRQTDIVPNLTGYATESWVRGNYLSLTGGSLSGELNMGTNWITTTSGNGLLKNDGTNSYVGVMSGTTYIRSGATTLIHRRNGTDYSIWDASNSNSIAADWKAKNLTLNGAITGATSVRASGIISSSSYLESKYLRTELNYNPLAAPRSVLGTYSIAVLDSYNVKNSSGTLITPTTYGLVLELTGLEDHWDTQIWIDQLSSTVNVGKIRYRTAAYNSTTWPEFKIIATEDWVTARINDLIAGAPAAFDTLKEIADVLQSNVNSIGDIMQTLSTKWTQDNTKISRWDTAYSWGNHASAGYLKASEFAQYFKKDTSGRIYCEVDFYSKKGITAFGMGSGSSGGGGSGTLAGLSDVSLTSPASGNLLKYNGTHWVNVRESDIVPNLTGYATESWVKEKYLPLAGGTLSGELSVVGDVGVSGLVHIAKNGNTVSIGSQNASYCHFINSKNIPFHFNRALYVTGDVYGGSVYNRRLAYADELLGQFWSVNGNVNLDTIGNTGFKILTNAASANATPANKYPVGEAGSLIAIQAAYSSSNQIYHTFSSNRLFIRGGGQSSTEKTAWREVWTTANFTPASYLPLSGGQMTGVIKLANGTGAAGIHTNSGNGLLMYDGATSTFLGQQAGTTYIRSGATNLIHRRDGSDKVIWDAANSNLTTVNWDAAKLYGATSVRGANLIIERTNEFNSATSADLHIGYRNTSVITIGMSGARVGIGRTATSYKLEVAGDAYATGNLFASGRAQAASLSSSDGRFNDWLAVYSGSSAPVGTIKITLPVGWSNSMNVYEIIIYEHNSNGASRILVSGYNYAASHGWYNYKTVISGSYDKGVRLAHDGAKCCILLGNTNTTWSYPQVFLKSVYAGYSNITSWRTAYSISLITSETGYTGIVTPDLSDGIFTNIYGTLKGNADTASRLATSRTLWGQSFNGSANVSGNLMNVATIGSSDNSYSIIPSTTNPYLRLSRSGVHFYTQVTSAGIVLGPGGPNGLTVNSAGRCSANVGLSVGYEHSSYKLSTDSFICNSWVRTAGAAGWYSETYKGGIYMVDSDYVRIYNAKRFYVNNTSNYSILTDGGFTRQGYGGASWDTGHGALNVAISDNTAQTPLIVAYRAGQTPNVTGANRLFAAEFLNNGTVLNIAFGGTWKFKLSNTGNFLASGGITAFSTSDRQLKKDIKSIKGSGSSILRKLNPVEFNWNDTAMQLNPYQNRHDMSFVAQEYEKLLPFAIGTVYEKYMGINKEPLFAILTAGWQEHDDEIKSLKKRVNMLEKENMVLKKKIGYAAKK